MKVLKNTLAVITAASVITSAVVWTEVAVITHKPIYVAGVASDKIKAAHAFHGILSSEMDEKGERYFIRQGRRCKLYTEPFERRWSHEYER